MENQYRYKLASNKIPKIECIHCGEKKHWQLYIDTYTDEALPDKYGKCDNDNKCGIWIKPKGIIKDEKLILKYDDRIVFSFTYDNDLKEKIKGLGASYDVNNKSWYLINTGIENELNNFAKKYEFEIIEHKKSTRSKRQIYIPNKVLLHTLKDYEKNIFLQNLAHNVPYPFEKTTLEKVVSLYRLGTYKSSLTIPYINEYNNVCAIQVKQFNSENHTTNTTFLHSIIGQDSNLESEWVREYNEQESKVSCLFGAHLLDKYRHNKIALVEAPKTAIIATLYFGFPDNQENFLWMAVYNLSSLNFERCKVLKGRDVYLFPDLSKDGKACRVWYNKAKELENSIEGSSFTISDLLEKFADKEARFKGFDLADYLIKHDWRHFRKTIKAKKANVPKQFIEPLKYPDNQSKINDINFVSESEREFLMNSQKGYLHAIFYKD